MFLWGIQWLHTQLITFQQDGRELFVLGTFDPDAQLLVWKLWMMRRLRHYELSNTALFPGTSAFQSFSFYYVVSNDTFWFLRPLCHLPVVLVG